MPIWRLLEPYWPWFAAGSGALTLTLIAASFIGLPWVLAGLPENILHIEPSPGPLRQRVILNVVGWGLIGLGLLMLLLPGQGLLSILAGVLIADVPGKRRWTVWILGKRPVRQAVNTIRVRRGAPPLS